MTAPDLLTLARFVLDRIAEDEQTALAAGGRTARGEQITEWRADGMQVVAEPDETLVVKHSWPREIKHITRHDPAHVLAELAVRRAAVESFAAWVEDNRFSLDQQDTHPLERLVRAWAALDADHPDYSAEWAPSSAGAR